MDERDTIYISHPNDCHPAEIERVSTVIRSYGFVPIDPLEAGNRKDLVLGRLNIPHLAAVVIPRRIEMVDGEVFGFVGRGQEKDVLSCWHRNIMCFLVADACPWFEVYDLRHLDGKWTESAKLYVNDTVPSFQESAEEAKNEG